jgi:hypothetical protein
MGRVESGVRSQSRPLRPKIGYKRRASARATNGDAKPGNAAIIAPMGRLAWHWTEIVATVRVLAFLAGWWWMTRHADWRQSVGYLVILVGSLPDALVVRYVVDPNSVYWPIAIALSLLVSSAIVVALFIGMRDR